MAGALLRAMRAGDVQARVGFPVRGEPVDRTMLMHEAPSDRSIRRTSRSPTSDLESIEGRAPVRYAKLMKGERPADFAGNE